MIAPFVVPMVRRMPISRPLSLTSIIRPEITLKAATTMIRERIMNIIAASVSRTRMKVSLRCFQSRINNPGIPKPLMFALVVATCSGSVVTISTASTVLSRRKNFWLSASGMKIMILSYSLIPISKMAVTG